ncbi:MAG TPA: glycoside hydrolase family 9 protein [Chryseolinea sp.]|nr:glycoside hydrolase family 9 protein [Chryseolinea sp.]
MNLKDCRYSLVLIALLLGMVACAQEKVSDPVRLNQIGFYPTAQKIAVVITDVENEFYIATPDLKKKLFSGKLSEVRSSPYSSKKTCIADFSAFTKEGNYVLVVPNIGQSYSFEIKNKVHDDVVKASIKSYYFQRASTSLQEQYAGKWKRKAGHPDDKVLIHGSAASEKRPEGFGISSSRGWYDAGDYNKYMVNSGITMGTMLSAYEDYSTYFGQLNLDIPESKNEVPDLLDELLWNLRWMLTMQDPNDGGVYHKCTNAKFDGMVMPDFTTLPRYAVQKGTAATLDFAAVTAQASRVYRKFEKQFPGLADSCLRASVNAWQWAVKNPNIEYNQNAINKQFDPDISTGAYGDSSFKDEFSWAASELYITTMDDSYYQSMITYTESEMTLPSWASVRALGQYSLLRFNKSLTPLAQKDFDERKRKLIAMTDTWLKDIDNTIYQTVMGQSKRDFVWGSNAVCANQGIALLYAYQFLGDAKYLNAALSNLDYLLGRNGTGYSFVTGSGDKTPMHPHHRPSEADGVVEPIPGLLAGGPNPNMQDKCNYSSSVADETYVDDVCSYASNEVAINWNAPLVYLVSAIEAIQLQKGK